MKQELIDLRNDTKKEIMSKMQTILQNWTDFNGNLIRFIG